MSDPQTAVAEALARCAKDRYPEGMRPGDHDPDYECPWGMGEVDWPDLAVAAVDALRSLPVEQRMEAMGMKQTGTAYVAGSYPKPVWRPSWMEAL